MTIMSILQWIVFGAVVGILARFLLPGRQAMTLVMTIVVGVVGSFAGGAISHLIFGGGAGFVQPSGWIMSVIGAIVVLLIYARVKSNQNPV